MPTTIKRNGDPAEGVRSFPGVTAGKDYPVQGFSGGGVIVVNDDGKFLHVGFADIDADWTVTDQDAAKKAADKAAADKAKKAELAKLAEPAEPVEPSSI